MKKKERKEMNDAMQQKRKKTNKRAFWFIKKIAFC